MSKYSVFADIFLKKCTNFCFYFTNKVVGREFELQTALAGTDVDVGELQAGFVDEGGKGFLHANGGAAATDVAGEG